MSKANNLTDFLTDLADGIRLKKGSSSPINPQNFKNEILSLPTSNIFGVHLRNIKCRPRGVGSTLTFVDKTWNGVVTSFDGNAVWTDGDAIYLSYNVSDTYYNYVLNQKTMSWETKTWKFDSSLPWYQQNIAGNQIWTDGIDIYCSYHLKQLVLDRSTETWRPMTWNGTTPAGGAHVWMDTYGEIFYTYNGTNLVLDRSTHTWSAVTFSLPEGYDQNVLTGSHIFSDGTNIYFGLTTRQFIYSASRTFTNFTWTDANGTTNPAGSTCFSDGSCTYIGQSANSRLWRIDGPGHMTQVSYTGISTPPDVLGTLWTDGSNIYYSSGSTQKVLVQYPTVPSFDQ